MLHLHECVEPAPAKSAVEPLQSVANLDAATDAPTKTSYS
jgi:hypothetical protein